MSVDNLFSSNEVHARLRKGLLVSTALGLTFASAAFAEPATEIDQDESIVFEEDSLSGQPEALRLNSTEGNITASVGSVSATSTDENQTLRIVELSTTDGSIDAAFDSIVSTGTGEVLALEASSTSGAINIDVGTVDLAGDFTWGVLATSETGDITLTGDSVNLAGTALSDEYNTGDAMVASTGGTADVTLGSGHTDGLYGSVAIAIGGEGARVEVGTASTTGEQGVAIYASSANGDATAISGTLEIGATSAAGVQVVSNNGMATIESGSVTGAGAQVSGLGANGLMGADVTAGAVSVGGVAIYANSAQGTASVATSGDIASTNSTAIDARGNNVEVTIGEGTTVSSTAPNSADNNGQFRSTVNVNAQNDATVTNNGLITGQNDAVALYVIGGGIVNVDAGDVSQTGTSFGVVGRSTAATGVTGVTINAGTVTGARGIRAETPNGADVVINTTGDITATAGNAISVSSQGSFTVTTAADTTITGTGGTAAVAGTASGGDAIVTNNGTVVALGATESGIGVTALNDVTIVSNAVTVEGAAAPTSEFKASGINASSTGGGDISITSNSVEVGGQGRYGISANTIGEGAITITSGTITHEADELSTIWAQTDSGAITIESGSIVNDGVSAKGIEAISQSGDVSITSESLINTAEGGGNVEAELFAEGIFANTGGAITIDSGLSEVYGFAASGIVALSASDISITADTTISHGAEAQALYAGTRSGDVMITSTDVVADLGSGIYGGSDAGDITINSGTAVAGLNASGVIGSTLDGDVTITTGAITAGRYGVLADATDVASVDVQGDIAAGGNYDNGRLSYAVYARGDVVNITTAEGTTSTGVDYGLLAAGQSGVTIDNGGTAAASAGTGSAIYATATGDISITSNSVVLSGEGADPGADESTGFRKGQGGIVAITDGAITIDSADATVSGDHRFGIYAQSDGPIDVTSGSLTYEAADSSGIFILGGSGDVAVTSETLIANGVSGSGIVARTGSGNITVDAGTTTATAEGIFGEYTADAIFVQSQTGDVTITSQDASSAGYGGSAIVGIGNNVSITSTLARTTGENAVAVYGSSNAPGGSVIIDSQTIEMSGNGAALYAIANNGGSAVVRVDDITASNETSVGIYASASNVDLTIDGDVSIGGNAVSLRSVGGTATMTVNGSVSSANGIGVSSFAQLTDLTVSEGGSITAERAAIAITNSSPEFSDTVYIRNEGSISGSAAVYSNPTQSGLFADVYMLNDGTITGTSGYAVYTGAGYDTLELTERSVVNGVVDLGDGEDRLRLDFNDEAVDGAIGQVAASANVEGLIVNTGNWRAETGNSFYGFIEIEESASLTVAQVDGYISVVAPVIELEGTLDLELTTDSQPGDLTGLTVVGDGSVVLSGPATLLVDDASGLLYTGGTFVQNGTLLLTDAYGGDITTSGDGVFQLGNGGTEGDYTGNLQNDGTFVFNRSDDYELLGDFNGSGSLVKDGAGTLFFGGAYGFTGTTSVLAGAIGLSGTIDPEATIDLSSGATFDLSMVEGGTATLAGLTGSGGTLVLGSTSLTVEQDGDTTFSGALEGTGTFTKTGTGDLKLTGDSPDYTGEAEVNGGILSVNGDYSNALFVVNQGGTLGGNGTLGEVTVNGGIFAPGNSIDTINIAGDLTLDATSIYEVEVNAAGQNDRTNVTGTATLGGATVRVLAQNGRYSGRTNYTILSAAGGLNGTFGTVTSNLAFLTPTLAYTGTDVTLTLTRNNVDFASAGLNLNQKNVGAALQSLGAGNALFEEVLLLTDTGAQTGFQSASGELYPAVSGALVETSQMVRRQMLQAPSSANPGFFGWGTMLGSFGSADANTNSSQLKTTNVGGMGGIGFDSGAFDARIGVGATDNSFHQNGSADATSRFVIGQVGFGALGPISAKIGASYMWHDIETQRVATVGVIGNGLANSYDARTFMAYGELDLLMPLGSIAVGPTGGLAYIRTDSDAFGETGGALALSAGKTSRDLTFGTIGLKFEGTGSMVRPTGSVKWRHAWGDRVSSTDLAFAGSSTFTSFGPAIDKDAAEVQLGLQLGNGPVTVSAGYSGVVGGEWEDHGGQLSLQITF